ncbi:hypothetical protein K0M31_000119 [Melipona bicolor]|uniref:Uncharacterized protein n=1 Tax=Melipona bicolor TaxID=60889 RepID=A0AA40GCZ1_9HYME|nr:hypothetical protein K0M31_000119 [Melipona bicolor]
MFRSLCSEIGLASSPSNVIALFIAVFHSVTGCRMIECGHCKEMCAYREHGQGQQRMRKQQQQEQQQQQRQSLGKITYQHAKRT